jgi:OPA family glycerol-3-phosphate transporter-like MFS transporter
MQERGRAFGLYLLAAGCSSLLTYALCIVVLSELGWRSLFRIPVASMLVGGLVFYVLARNRPEDLGFNPAEMRLIPRSSRSFRSGFLGRYRSLLGHRGFLLGCVTIGLESTARYGLLTWTPLLFWGTGWKDEPANLWINLLLPLGMAVGAFSCGLLSDRFFGSNRPIPVALFLGAGALVSLLLFLLQTSDSLLVGFLLFLAGFLVFGPQASLWALCPDLLGRARTGTAIGFMDAVAYAFAALSGPLYGLVIEATGETSVVFVLNAAACALGAAAIALADTVCRRSADLG